jgi:hypothetical protein
MDVSPELYPKLTPGDRSSQLRRYISKAEHDQPVTKNHIREFPEPYPNRIRNVERDQPSHPRKTAKTEFPGNQRTPRARESPGVTRFWAGMAVGMPRPQRLEKLRIWEPGVVSRAGAQRGGGYPGCRWGGAKGFQNFSFSESGPR